MNSEDAVPFKQSLSKRGVGLCGSFTFDPEGRDAPMQGGIVWRQYFNAGERPCLPYPAIAKGAQPGGARGPIDLVLECERGGDGQTGSVIERPGMDMTVSRPSASSAGSRSIRASAPLRI